MAWLIAAIFISNHPEKYHIVYGVLHGAILLYITITFLVFASILAPSQGVDFPNFILHYFVPLAFVIDWVLTEVSNFEYQWKYLIIWMIFPLLYIVSILIYGSITFIYPYFFLDLPQLGPALFFAWIGGFIVLFIGIGSMIIAINRRLFRKTQKRWFLKLDLL
jgi:hypothetical protein